MASRTESGFPSNSELRAKTSQAARTSGISVRKPRKRTRLASVGMASANLCECFDEQGVILLSREAGYANKQHVVFCKAFLRTPLSARYTGIRVSTCWNAICDDPALWNAVEALHADSDLFPHGDRNDAMAERVT